MKTYTVQSGDTLSSIAQNILGNAGLWKSIYEANRDILSNPNKIQVGQRLKMPGKGSTTTTTTTKGGMLRLGSRGTAVTTLQQNLNAIDYSINTDGIFGPATDRAVRDVQATYGLSPDGIVGPQTLQLIAAILNGNAPEFDGDTSAWWTDDSANNAIAGWQRDLIALGYVIVITGFLDQETLDALHQFQSDNGLEVTDSFDDETRGALYDQSSALEDDEDFDEDEETAYFDDEDESDDEDSDDESDDEDEESDDSEESDDEDEESDDSEEADDEDESDEGDDEATDESEDESDDSGDDGGGDDGGGDDGGGDDGGGGDGGDDE